MHWQALIVLTCLVGIEAHSNRSRLRHLLSRIENLMSPLKRHRRMDSSQTFSPPIEGKCGLGEELRFCRPMCEPTCAEPHPICSATCAAAVCMCQRGSVRQAGLCIPKSACKFFDTDFEPTTTESGKTTVELPTLPPSMPALHTKTSDTAILHRPLAPPPNCGQGQQFTRCVCDASCTRNKICESCSSGCGCFLHYVRNDDGICIPLRDCPNPRPKLKPISLVLSTGQPTKVSEMVNEMADTIMSENNFKAPVQSVDGTVFPIASAHPMARAVKTARKVSLSGVKTISASSSSNHSGQISGHNKLKKRSKTPEGPLPPVSASESSATKSTKKQNTKSKKIVRQSKSKLAPPTSTSLHKPLRRKRMPPSARPQSFGPPGVTPLLFFRSQRIARKERTLERLKRRRATRHAVLRI